MSADEIKKIGKDNGLNLIVLQKWHIVLMLIGIFIGVGIIYGTSQTRLNVVESKVTKIEIWKEGHMKDVEVIKGDIDIKLHELQLNQKALMERFGIKYQKIE